LAEPRTSDLTTFAETDTLGLRREKRLIIAIY
jgi:hypothetical protein